MNDEYKKTFKIDTANSDRQYLLVDVAGKGSVVIKSEGEGLVVDIYPLGVADEPVATTWADMSLLWTRER